MGSRRDAVVAPAAMVEFEGVSKVYGQGAGRPIRALAEASFRVAPGELVVISGSSGAGKTTLVRLVIGEERATEGSVRVADQDVATLGRRALGRLRRQLAVAPQEPRLVADRTAFGNVMLVQRGLGVPAAEARARALAALRGFGLGARANAVPRELSGSERRRVALARALAQPAPLLLLDEPFAGLDDPTVRRVVDRVVEAHRQGITVVITTRDAARAAVPSARRLRLAEGRLEADGVAAGG
jgi:cell division transport system ATP-binding protein